MMLVGWVVMATLLIAVLMLARGSLDRRDSVPAAGASARRILDDRLARGEIDVEEHRARRVEIDNS